MKRLLVLMVVSAICAASCAGCAKKPAEPSGKVIAEIGRYKLTTEDYADETRLTVLNKYLSGDARKAREELLDELIIKKALIQEAQRQNFDKDRAFMKEIERYWEQALIKLMIRKKMEELSGSVSVTELEVRGEYDRLVKESGGKIGPFESMAGDLKEDLYKRKMEDAFDNWLKNLRDRSGVKIHKENL